MRPRRELWTAWSTAQRGGIASRFATRLLSPLLGARIEDLEAAYRVRHLPAAARPAVAVGRGVAGRVGELTLSVEDLRAFKECPRRSRPRQLIRSIATTQARPRQGWLPEVVLKAHRRERCRHRDALRTKAAGWLLTPGGVRTLLRGRVATAALPATARLCDPVPRAATHVP